MRIGIVSVSYLPRLGGAVTQTILWHGYLTKHGHHVEVFCPDLSNHGRLREEGIIVNRVRHRWARSYDSNVARVFLMNELRAAVQSRRKDFDVFITPEFNIGPLSLCFTVGTKTIGTYGADLTFEFINIRRREIIPYETVLVRDIRKLGFKNYIVATLLEGLQRFMFKRLDCVVVINREDRHRIEPKANQTALIGCMMKPLPESVESQHKPASSPRNITIIGRAVSWKRIDDSIELALKFKAVYPQITIEYFGTGPELPRIEREYGSQIRIQKELRNEEVLRRLTRSDITVNLSRYETFCIVNAEAMLSRSLLVVHPLAAYNDYLRDDFNCIMAGEDKEAVVQRVKAAFDSNKARELLVAAQQTIREKYSVEHIGPQLEALLREIAGTNAWRTVGKS